LCEIRSITGSLQALEGKDELRSQQVYRSGFAF
jgi:hypothetical protein